MRLREKIRPPVRFEDEAVAFNIPKKKLLQIPAFPEMMAQQVVPFDKNATPAVFPSLPLNASSPSPPSLTKNNTQMQHETSPSHQPDVAAEDIQSDDIEPQQFPCIDDEDTLRWRSLELAVQFRVWINLCHEKSQEYARNLLGLTHEEFHNIRVAVFQRRQCPFDSSRLLATLDSIEDFDGARLDSFTPTIIFSQQYELAFPLQIERGRRFLNKRQLEEQLLGSWWPDPEGSGYLKSVPDIFQGSSTQVSVDADSGYASASDSAHALQAETGTEPFHVVNNSNNDNIQQENASYSMSGTEYRQNMQAKAAQLRLLRTPVIDVPQVVPLKSSVQASNTSTVLKEPLQTDKSELPATFSSRMAVINTGIDPVFANPSPSMSPSPDPETLLPDEPELVLRANPPVEHNTDEVPTQPNLSIPILVGDRSSGSMSLRSRNSLRETQAMAALKENARFWECELEHDSLNGSHDNDVALPRATEQKVLSLKIDNKDALASIVHGEDTIWSSKSGVESNTFSSSLLYTATRSQRSNLTSDLPDDPDLYASYFLHAEFPKDEKQRLLSIPVKERSLVEMWLIYGKNTWKPESPWNVGCSEPRFEKPALGAKFNRDDAGSLVLRTFVDEWNRSQSYGIGQNIVEETTISHSLLKFINKVELLKQQKISLMEDEKVLNELGYTGRNNDQINPLQLYQKAVQSCLAKVKHEVNQVYAQKFAHLGKVMPNVKFRTPSIARVGQEDAEEMLRKCEDPNVTVLAITEPPEQPVYRASANGFVMKLIESPSTGVKEPKTPSEDNLGIFGADGADLRKGLQQDQSEIGSAEQTQIIGGNTFSGLALREGDSPLNWRHEKATRVSRDNRNDAGKPYQSNRVEDAKMVDAPAVSEEATARKTVTYTPATAPKHSKGSPNRPSWSPISDNEKFHSALGTPLSTSDQRFTAQPTQIVHTDADIEDDTEEHHAQPPVEAKPSEDSVLPSIETDESKQPEKNAGKSRTTPKIMLKFRQAMTLESTPPVSPYPPVNTADKQKKSAIKSTPATKDTVPTNKVGATASELPTRVTRSMTSTPVPVAMLPLLSSTTSHKKRKTAPGSSTQPQATKKKTTAAKAKNPVNAQVQKLKDEEGVEGPSVTPGKEVPSAKRIPAQKTSKAKGNTKMDGKTGTTSSSLHEERQPYKKTRESIAKASLNGDSGSRGVDVAMTG